MSSVAVNDRRRVTMGGELRPEASDNLFRHSELTGADGMRLRVTVPAERAGTPAAISSRDWEKSLSLSKQLYCRVGPIKGALIQKAWYAVGDAWEPDYTGEDEAWGHEAKEMLEPWFQVCDLRGEPYDFQANLFVSSIAYDREGDEACIYTKDSQGEPRFQVKPAHCIAQRGDWGQDQTGFGTVPSGPYKGARGYNGVIFDRAGKVIAYNFLGATPKEDRQVSTASCQLLYEPDWADQGRGIAPMATGLLDWMDYEDIHHFLKRQIKQDSAMGILHWNETGSAPTGRNFIHDKPGGSTNSDVKYEQVEGNEIFYFKALGGGKIAPYESGRPHPNVDNYAKRIIRGALSPIGWFYELYDPSEIGGANTRLIQDMARMSIWWRQRTLRKSAIRKIRYALSCWMESGALRRNDRDWHKWEFSTPAEITVDARYDDKTWMERIRMCAGTYQDFFGEKGSKGGWKGPIRQRIKEQKFLQEECKREGVDAKTVQILTPNANEQRDSEQETEQKDKKDKK